MRIVVKHYLIHLITLPYWKTASVEKGSYITRHAIVTMQSGMMPVKQFHGTDYQLKPSDVLESYCSQEMFHTFANRESFE